MGVDYSEKRFRSDFKAERDRVISAIRECEELDKELTTSLTGLRRDMNRVRGAASLVVRLTEQQIANRNQRLALVKELRLLKRDVLEREIKLAQLGSDQAVAGAVSAELLRRLQGLILGQGLSHEMLEPGELDDLIAAQLVGDAPEEVAPEEVAPEDGTEEQPEEGSIIADQDGNTWVVGPDGLEPAGVGVEELDLEPEDGSDAFAILVDGSVVPVYEIRG
jgi:hypothetical protein